ncbi:RNA-guided endonuclease TnpB family protein [Lentzea sp. BCCO 10_0061]|uniref:RNA-guided endonuclease TnpB family protein n=1 Tax=Lentzea sokolovensis TaxID=3095429 RepID=A0ABU4UPW5_9PSEU|nr:RNA-guided endonuclease TnpB family protein [Lentzea sp. BCCO 10_0061]MDX8140836.1 RNA-guided endonuclease TnpB family protein [Lentzea sp. BCCO 10_0061]
MGGHVKRAFKYRFYPTASQAAELSRTFGCVRKVYNLALQVRSEAWSQHQERVGYGATSAMLTDWKRADDLAFLNEVSCVPLQQALRHLQVAFFNFWDKRAAYPRYKSRKRSRASAEYTRSAFRWREGTLTLAKMSEPLNVRWSRSLPDGVVPSTVTVSRDSAGRWFVSMLCEDPRVMPLPRADSAVGIDVGIDHLLVLSNGEKIANPRHERRDRTALAKAQRSLSRKEPGSNNLAKAGFKVARVHARIADRRSDFLQKITTRLVRENQALVIEDLAVSNMVGNRRLARVISDAGWRQFRQMLEYKAAWYGRDLVLIDRWFPSSKLCSVCGTTAATMPLHVRKWTCGCGATHDRDVNAALNILAAGLAVTVCGADVGPQRSIPGGQSAKKQKAPRRELRDSLLI